MNPNNENMHSAIVALLQSQELEEKAIKAQFDAAVFTLYHAEGATIAADKKLEASKNKQHFKELVKVQAVNSSTASTNLLASANQAGTYLKQAVTNAAMCASNVQVAATAIVRLAGDVESIFSIIKAAYTLTEIYGDAKEVSDSINDTAYAAEIMGQMAMEASTFTSEVSAQTLFDKSKKTGYFIG